ncbi:MAG: DUF4508 domain-containing protein [Methylacidiphilales bacterium]|nr:DUF4508 domain-containing protein [Candidatus Methylacidiphilales bacterium]
MSKKKHTAESRLKPGSPKNLPIALWGDQWDPRYNSIRNMVHDWLNSPARAKLVREWPKKWPKTDRKKLVRKIEQLKMDTLQFVKEAIIKNQPEDLRKFADVIERTHETKKVDKFGNLSFDAASSDLAQIEIYRFLTVKNNPSHKFTLKELRKVVARVNGNDPDEANENADRRVRRIAEKIGIKLVSDNKS